LINKDTQIQSLKIVSVFIQTCYQALHPTESKKVKNREEFVGKEQRSLLEKKQEPKW
jgi:hypothetical protein